MNRERAKELLPIIQAFAEGREIQFRRRTSPNEWCYPWDDLPDEEAALMTFPADDYEYRIKPLPREWIVHLDRFGNFVPEDSMRGVVKESILVREVIE